MCGVSSLENRIGSLGLLLALPKQMLAKTDGQFCRKHVPASCPWRKSKLMASVVGSGHDDRLCSCARDFGYWFETPFHCQWKLIRLRRRRQGEGTVGRGGSRSL